MAEMETAISELRVMVGVLLALVVLLLVGVVALLLRLTSSKGLKVTLPVFFRSKDEGRASIEKHPPPPSNKVPNENRNSTVVRIADYQVTFTFSFYSAWLPCVLLSECCILPVIMSFSLCNGNL